MQALRSVPPENLVASCPAMLNALRAVHNYAPAATPVLLVGETGTGKSSIARLLHDVSGRQGAFRDISGGELEPNLAADQLFGHVVGSFTGARGRRAGIVAEAANGTLLLDDFHLLPRQIQYLLLRPFDRRLYRSVGLDSDAPLSCRLVVGLGEDPDALVARGEMLKDLRYRLEYCIIRLPRLEERREEIALFAAHFLSLCREETGVTDGPTEFAPDVIAALEAGHYAGNLRDLKGRVRAAYLLARGESEIRYDHLPHEARDPLAFDLRADRQTKVRLVAWALRRTEGHVGRAAELLRVHRNTVTALRGEGTGRGRHAANKIVHGDRREQSLGPAPLGSRAPHDSGVRLPDREVSRSG
jgi:two-component system NtrC family response regulator